MKYFISDFKDQRAKDDLRSLGLFCYSLRSSEDNWGEIATIENHVLVNRYGSIITNQEISLGNQYPDNFLDFQEFSLSNEQVNSICELDSHLEDCGIIDLSNDENIELEFSSLFSELENYEELSKMNCKEKFDYYLAYYDKISDYQLVNKSGHLYQLFHILKEDKEQEND